MNRTYLPMALLSAFFSFILLSNAQNGRSFADLKKLVVEELMSFTISYFSRPEGSLTETASKIKMIRAPPISYAPRLSPVLN